jgi:phosphatidylinositol alpha-mannosyltransferase
MRGLARAEALCWSRVAGRVLNVYASAARGSPALEATA